MHPGISMFYGIVVMMYYFVVRKQKANQLKIKS